MIPLSESQCGLFIIYYLFIKTPRIKITHIIMRMNNILATVTYDSAQVSNCLLLYCFLISIINYYINF